MALKSTLLPTLLVAVWLCLAVPLDAQRTATTSSTEWTGISIPDGAEAFSWTVYDDDGLLDPDDKLYGPSLDLAIGDEEELDVTYNYGCDGGSVTGPCGSSGERNAELYVVITWKFPGGSSSTTTTSPNPCQCSNR